MEFAFTQEQELVQETVGRFAREKLLPRYSRWDRGEKIKAVDIREVAELGIFRARIPDKYGGQHVDFVTCGIMSEALALGDFNYTLFLQLSMMISEILVSYALPDVQKEWLPQIATGQAIFALALTEPQAGSDVAKITSSAKRSGDDYILNGEKASITFAGNATAGLVLARTAASGARGISVFLVPFYEPGVTRRVYESVGARLHQRGSIFFDDVRLPARYLVGKENGGFYQAMAAFDFNRALVALAAVGAAQQTLDETILYTQGRRVFSKALATFEGVAFQVAEYLTMLEAVRTLAYKCLWLKDQERPHTKEAAMVKWMGPKVAAEAIHACMILHGHHGYNLETPFEQRWRDILGFQIGDGTPEVMKGIVAREAFGKEYTAYRT